MPKTHLCLIHVYKINAPYRLELPYFIHIVVEYCLV